MKQYKTIIFSSALLIFLSACAPLFETTADVQARKALQDLMEIQNKYHQEHKKYARNLLSIQDYNLKYNAGVVYLEIESASQDKYRAIAIPAESTTARVFAYDSDKGGFYEMQDDEVKTYVLGALKHIRAQQKNTRTKDYISFALAIALVAFGIKSLANATERGSAPVFLYFLSLFPMTWALIVLNHMDKKIVFSRSILGITIAALLCAIVSILGSGLSFAKLPRSETAASLQGLLIAAIAGSLFGCWAVAYTLFHFYRA